MRIVLVVGLAMAVVINAIVIAITVKNPPPSRMFFYTCNYMAGCRKV